MRGIFVSLTLLQDPKMHEYYAQSYSALWNDDDDKSNFFRVLITKKNNSSSSNSSLSRISSRFSGSIRGKQAPFDIDPKVTFAFPPNYDQITTVRPKLLFKRLASMIEFQSLIGIVEVDSLKS